MENQTITLRQPPKIWRYVEFFGVTIIGPLLLKTKVIASENDFWVLFTTFAIVSLFVSKRILAGKWGWKDLGITSERCSGLKWYALWIILALICCFIAPYLLPTKPFNAQSFTQYTVFGSILQEILYRGYCWKLGLDLFSKPVNIRVNILLFTLMHAYFPNPEIVLPIVFLSGILFTLLYSKYENLFLICLLHIPLNALAMYIKIF